MCFLSIRCLSVSHQSRKISRAFHAPKTLRFRSFKAVSSLGLRHFLRSGQKTQKNIGHPFPREFSFTETSDFGTHGNICGVQFEGSKLQTLYQVLLDLISIEVCSIYCSRTCQQFPPTQDEVVKYQQAKQCRDNVGNSSGQCKIVRDFRIGVS